jgi:hypothetical protein
MNLDLKSPKEDDANFTRYWNMFVADIQNRENLKPSHLQQLSILCDISVQYDFLTNVLSIRGYTYESIGRNGVQIKQRPELLQLNKILSEIRNYSKMLGLVLFKDTETTKSKKRNEFEDDDDDDE